MPADKHGGREDRLAAALRTNLARRKAAARAAGTSPEDGAEGETG